MYLNITSEQIDFLWQPLRDYILPIILFFAVAFLIMRFARHIAAWLQPISEITQRKNPRRAERLKTLQALIASAIRVGALSLAIILTLSRFVSAETLIWIVGLFSAAFGLGARPFISDYLTGITLIFEDTYDVGEKIEFPMFPQRVEGVVEEVNLRTTRIRGMDGELYTMPNGDIRLVRNFSRGTFSPARVTLSVPAEKLAHTLERLNTLKFAAMTRLPNLIEPLQILSETGELGEKAELTILARARFGKGAELRTRLLAYLQQELQDAQVKMTPDDVDEAHAYAHKLAQEDKREDL